MLTSEEKAAFLRDGYVTRQIRLDPVLQARAIDLVWEEVVGMNPGFLRDDPDSWKGDVIDSCRSAGMAKRRGRVKLRECVRDADWLVDMIYGNSEVLAVVRDLLGPKGGPRRKIRGLYPIFPSPTSSNRLAGGMDAHPFQVCCIIYLSDVAEDGGAFNLWKGSHEIMKHCFAGKASWDIDKDRAEALRLEAEARCERVSLPGPAGTAIFWHHRALHTPGTNRTRSVRHALIADFLQSDWEDKKHLSHEVDSWADWAIRHEVA